MAQLESISKVKLAAVAVLIALTAGCSAQTSPDVDRARAAYRDAAADSTVAANASAELADAKRALDRARHELKDAASDEAVEHYAYVASQKIAIARVEAQRKESLRAAEELAAQRGDVTIDARTREAAAARARVYERDLADARRTDKGLVLTLGDVLFETGGSDLRPGALQSLAKLVAFLQDNPGRAVVVEGHTDDVGDEAANEELSLRRASSVRNFLVSNGMTADRVTVRGYGEAFPVAPNSNVATRQQNRRVEVVILDAGAEPMADAVLSRPPLGMQGR